MGNCNVRCECERAKVDSDNDLGSSCHAGMRHVNDLVRFILEQILKVTGSIQNILTVPTHTIVN